MLAGGQQSDKRAYLTDRKGHKTNSGLSFLNITFKEKDISMFSILYRILIPKIMPEEFKPIATDALPGVPPLKTHLLPLLIQESHGYLVKLLKLP